MTKNTSPLQPNLKVLFAATEAAPLVKVGGLGDVAGSLPKALKSLSMKGLPSVDIRVVIPFHKSLRNKFPNPPQICNFQVLHIDGPIEAEAYQIEFDGLIYYLIDGPPIQAASQVYDVDPVLDADKYIFFSQALLEMARQIKWLPDILHANDWHTAASVYAMHTSRKFTADFFRTQSILTIHNLPFMGANAEVAMQEFKLTQCNDPRLPEWGCKQPLPLGILTADHIVTVSPTYAQEIMTPEFGCGLEEILTTRKDRVSGILNGLDIESWDPSTDPELPAQYSWDSLEFRKLNKNALLKEFDLQATGDDVPLIVIISRLFHQKGIDLALSTLRQNIDLPWQAIILGTGEDKLEAACAQLQNEYPQKVRSAIRFDMALSRRMYGGADMLLIPSRYEPCGLTQMIAMRYGCIPVARATGGLKDTIVDDPEHPENNTGFLFNIANVEPFSQTLQRALQTYSDKKMWTSMQIHGMHQDFSWTRSALQYVDIYQQLRKELP